MSELKPCPFCGGEAVNKQDGEPIYCGSCYSSMPYGICEKDMIGLWNSRTQNDKLTEENKMLRKALHNLHCTGVDHFNGSYDDEEDLAAVESNFNDALILAEEALEQTK